MIKIKEKVLKEFGMNYEIKTQWDIDLEKAIDLTLAEVRKEIERTKFDSYDLVEYQRKILNKIGEGK